MRLVINVYQINIAATISGRAIIMNISEKVKTGVDRTTLAV